ncbi:hypothetical protein ACNPQM_22070 [Streptomyces sp. NPDC056231]|uniref:hypothetical protein n=1 Tax=Streptomyces sp. NPDC056231 TaxID=3345755 RepID=UPI003AAB2595
MADDPLDIDGQDGLVDPELEPFPPLIPKTDLSDPVTARENYAARAAAAPAPDTSAMQVDDHTVSADPDVPVRIYHPHGARSALVWLHGGAGSWGTWTPITTSPPESRPPPTRR